MGGSGGGNYIPPTTQALQEKLEKARQQERQRLDKDVNRFLQDILTTFNDRDVDRTSARLEEIADVLGQDTNLDTLLFGGSVAKHTYVDGLSDVDALAILDRKSTRGLSPQHVLDQFDRRLREGLSRRDVDSIEKGTLAVTVRYRDGTEVQLLPSVRSRNVTSIPDASGSGWNSTNPRVFQREISRQNQRLNNAFVPTVKLMKSLVGDLPQQQQVTGYHAEALALDAVKGYLGPTTPRALLTHVVRHAAERVARPIADVTGQSRNVDEYLGAANSSRRRLVSQALSGIRRRLEAATSLTQWKGMFGRVEK